MCLSSLLGWSRHFMRGGLSSRGLRCPTSDKCLEKPVVMMSHTLKHLAVILLEEGLEC